MEFNEIAPLLYDVTSTKRLIASIGTDEDIYNVEVNRIGHLPTFKTKESCVWLQLGNEVFNVYPLSEVRQATLESIQPKYELVDIPNSQQPYAGITLKQIRALRPIQTSKGLVEAGELGGYVAGEHNLSQFSDAWIFDEACAYDESLVRTNSFLSDKAVICDNAVISDHSTVSDMGFVYGDSLVLRHSSINNRAVIKGQTIICDNSVVNDASIIENVKLYYTYVDGDVLVSDTIIGQGQCISNADIRPNELVYVNSLNKSYAFPSSMGESHDLKNALENMDIDELTL